MTCHQRFLFFSITLAAFIFISLSGSQAQTSHKNSKKSKKSDAGATTDTIVDPYAKETVNLLTYLPLDIKSNATFIIKNVVYKGKIKGPGRLVQILPDGLFVQDEVIAGAKTKFINSMLTLSWDELPDDSVFAVSYKVKPINITGSFEIVSNLYLERTGKEYKFRTSLDIEPAKEGIAEEKPIASIGYVEKESNVSKPATGALVLENVSNNSEQTNSTANTDKKKDVEKSESGIAKVEKESNVSKPATSALILENVSNNSEQTNSTANTDKKKDVEKSESGIAKVENESNVSKPASGTLILENVGNNSEQTNSKANTDKKKEFEKSESGIVKVEKESESKKPNSYNPQVEKEIKKTDNAYDPNDVEYRVQVRAGYRAKIPIETLAKKFNLNVEFKEDCISNWCHYSVGSFGTYEQAREYRNILIKEHGVSDAFIVAFYQGRRLNELSELKEIAPETYPIKTVYKEGGYCYRVQILALMHKSVSPETLRSMHNIAEEVNEETYHNWRKYTVGKCTSLREAKVLLANLKEKGISDSFIVIYKNGERVLSY